MAKILIRHVSLIILIDPLIAFALKQSLSVTADIVCSASVSAKVPTSMVSLT
jgi:hypothetical protein